MARQRVLTGGTVVDGTGAPPRRADVVLDGDRIAAVLDGGGPAGSGPDAPEVLDVSSATVLPGLIDAHCHMTLGEPNSNDEMFFHREEGYSAIVAAWNAPKVLRAGVTGVLDADGLFNLPVSLRDAIEAGMVEGPRMKVGGNALLTSVGGTAGRLIPDHGRRGYAMVVRNHDEMVMVTRQQIKYGADWIKIHVTGLIPGHKGGELSVWTLDELRTVCETAHALGIPTVAHCRNAGSVRDAARAGVDLILHGSFMDDEALEALVESGAALAPTFTFLANLVDYGAKVGAAPQVIDIFRDEIERSAPMIRRAFDAGVPLLAGSESGFSITPYGHWHARELELFVRHLGLTPLEAITCATANGRLALRRDDVGTLEPGGLADVIVVDGDPVHDIRILQDRSRLRHVFKGGAPVDLDRPWPERVKWPGEGVGTYGNQMLTWELVNP